MRHAYLLVLAVSSAAYADDPFSCVDPLVAEAFLGDAYRGRGEYSTSVPEGFAALNLPSGLTLVGSQAFDSMTTVVYQANMKPQKILDAAVEAMASAGWSEDEQQFHPARGGFQTSSRPTSTVLCHEDHAGSLTIIATDRSGQTFVSYMQYPDSTNCGGREEAEFRYDPTEMMRLVPTMTLPRGATAKNTGMGGNGDEVSSHVDISGSPARPDLMSHFEDQIRKQGWVYQTGWSSQRSSGSVWMLESPDDGLLIGTLHLFDTGTDPVRVRFSVNPAHPQKGSDQVSWSGSST